MYRLLIPFVAVTYVLSSATPVAALENFKFNNTQSISAALWACINLSNRTYSVEDNDASEERLTTYLNAQFGLTKVDVLRRSKYDTLAVVASNANVVVVAFRGTMSGSDLNKKMNRAIVLRPSWKYKPYKGDKKRLGLLPPMIHSGWLSCMDDWYSKLRGALKDDHGAYNKAIFITGHSLGGALAPLFAQRYIGETGGMKTRLGVHVLTFGAPMVGNDRFVKMYKDNREKHTKFKIDHYAYYHEDDDVATKRRGGVRRAGKWLTIDTPTTFNTYNQEKNITSPARVVWWDDKHSGDNYELAMKLRMMQDVGPEIYERGALPITKIGKGVNSEKQVVIKSFAWPNYLNPEN